MNIRAISAAIRVYLYCYTISLSSECEPVQRFLAFIDAPIYGGHRLIIIEIMRDGINNAFEIVARSLVTDRTFITIRMPDLDAQSILHVASSEIARGIHKAVSELSVK